MTDSLPPEKDRAAETDDVENGSEQGSSSRPLSRLFPANTAIWHEAYRLASQRDSRVEDLAMCILQDPALTLETLRSANGLFVVDGRPPTTTVSAAIVRLGSDLLRTSLQRVSERHSIEDKVIANLFELHRGRCRRMGIISRMLAEVLAKTLVEDCHCAGVFGAIGDMLAIIHLQQEFLKLYTLKNQATINYRLSQDYRFDVETMRLLYLRKHGVPELLSFAIDREGTSKGKERAIMKPICFAAMEFSDTFDAVKWEKLAPGKQLPPKSAIKVLGLTDSQYLKLYEKISEYLFLEKSNQEKSAAIAEAAHPEPEGIDISSRSIGREDAPLSDDEFLPRDPSATEPEQDDAELKSLDNELFALLEEVEVSAPPPPPPPRISTHEWSPVSPPIAPPTHVRPPVDPPVRKRLSQRDTLLEDVGKIIDAATNSRELLNSILDMLISSGISHGPFEKSALIVVSADRQTARVVAARGPSITKGEVLFLEDPLSPLAQCFSKVQSFGTHSNASSPWGSKAFALAPLNANHGTPVALYADCGPEGKLPFDARRVFRNVVEILNSRLPNLPGGIPIDQE